MGSKGSAKVTQLTALSFFRWQHWKVTQWELSLRRSRWPGSTKRVTGKILRGMWRSAKGPTSKPQWEIEEHRHLRKSLKARESIYSSQQWVGTVLGEVQRLDLTRQRLEIHNYKYVKRNHKFNISLYTEEFFSRK